MTFNSLEKKFNLYLSKKQIKVDTIKNYNSWLKFIENEGYNLNYLSIETIKEITKNLELTIEKRTTYKTQKDISNFKSALNNFFSFMKNLNDDDFEYNQIKENTNSKQVILARLGQGDFRKSLLNKYSGKCIISGCSQEDILIASHIKPWKYSNNKERLNPNNGFLLIPNYDKLFDKGYISINPKTLKIECSQKLLPEIKNIFTLNNIDLKTNINEEQLVFIKYHYENIFKS